MWRECHYVVLPVEFARIRNDEVEFRHYDTDFRMDVYPSRDRAFLGAKGMLPVWLSPVWIARFSTEAALPADWNIIEDSAEARDPYAPSYIASSQEFRRFIQSKEVKLVPVEEVWHD